MTRIPCGSRDVDRTHTCHNDGMCADYDDLINLLNLCHEQIPASRLTSRRLDRGLFRSRADAFRTIRTILRLSITLPTPSEYILDPSTCPNICSSNMMSSPSSLQTPMAVNRNLSSSLQAIPRRVPTVHPANVHFNE
ncbi:hypothetical protein WG66_008332 [Moniliophthora roreri]|nr:hypothetical protein WG66_008332 [Moniliophthora roreri]